MINFKQISSATSGTVTITDAQDDIELLLTGGIALTLTVTLPATPLDGQRVTIRNDNGVTTLTMTTPVGTIANPLSALAIGTPVTYIYDSAGSKWHR